MVAGGGDGTRRGPAAQLADLTVPGREAHVQAAYLSLWQRLDLCDRLPVRHPLATLPRHVPPNPSTLRLTAEIDATDDHITQDHLGGPLEAQNAP